MALPSTVTSARSSPAESLPSAANPLKQEYETWQALFEAQSARVQRFLQAQGRRLAEALTQRDQPSQVSFTLPDQIAGETGSQPAPVPPDLREQMAGGLVDRLTRSGLSHALNQRLAELEQSPNRALAAAAGLLKHTLAIDMVNVLLPAGRSVMYAAAEGEEIPSIPVAAGDEPKSAVTAQTDAIVEEGEAEVGRGELLVPFVPAARQFYMPQWVAFDDSGRLLVGSAAEAEAYLASMQRFLEVLHMAVALAPYVVADQAYQQKRYGMLGQLVNQGRALARYQTAQIIEVIKRRAAAQDLNRGLSLSLPYFDDRDLKLKNHRFEVIPAGRIMFVPAFVVRSARHEQVKVAQDTRLSPSTRKHLLAELDALGQAFQPDPQD
jgi:hypothetical protein